MCRTFWLPFPLHSLGFVGILWNFNYMQFLSFYVACVSVKAFFLNDYVIPTSIVLKTSWTFLRAWLFLLLTTVPCKLHHFPFSLSTSSFNFFFLFECVDDIFSEPLCVSRCLSFALVCISVRCACNSILAVIFFSFHKHCFIIF